MKKKTQRDVMRARIAKCDRRIANPKVSDKTREQAVEQKDRLLAILKLGE